jgi:hypothetical protein
MWLFNLEVAPRLRELDPDGHGELEAVFYRLPFDTRRQRR